MKLSKCAEGIPTGKRMMSETDERYSFQIFALPLSTEGELQTFRLMLPFRGWGLIQNEVAKIWTKLTNGQ
jgi:hypothetical protein